MNACVFYKEKLHLYALQPGLCGHGGVCMQQSLSHTWVERATARAKWHFVSVPTSAVQQPGAGKKTAFIYALMIRAQKLTLKLRKNIATAFLLCNHGDISCSEYWLVCGKFLQIVFLPFTRFQRDMLLCLNSHFIGSSRLSHTLCL